MTHQQLLTLRILWASLLMSSVFLVVVIFLITGADAIVWSRALPALSPDAESLPSMLLALCVAPLLASSSCRALSCSRRPRRRCRSSSARSPRSS